jgi:tetratricopeptide (TPR) repeat protein
VEEKLRNWLGKQDRVSLLISLFVFLVSFSVYLKTMAPTVSFWDCGEFIACAYILGIAHPPGSPLFVLIGRLFALIPLADQIAVRINFISALTSALTVWLTYLLIVKLVSRWDKEDKSLWLRIARYVGGVVGSLFLAFSMTFWSNAVEAEVYGASMLLTMLILFLALIWMDHKATPKGDKLLILIAYLGLLSTGIHMTVFLVMPGIFLLIVLSDRRKLLDWRFWVTGMVLALVMHSVVPFLISLGIWLFLTLIFTLFSKQRNSWAFFLLLTLAGTMGYSTQLFIPIRSYQEPAIDESNPSDWPSFKAFLERKQYGEETMIGRMFHRRGSWANQFGAKERMGFWGFFREQYMDKSLWFIPIFLGLFGIWEQIKRRKNEGVVLLFLLLAGTLGLILYMNFADGTRPDPVTGEIIRLEVRDRDYFWTPGFVFFALIMGLGAFGVIKNLGGVFEKRVKSFQPVLGIIVAVLLVLPLLALKKNYRRNDRTGNWIPYDYAYNHLMSCDKDGMLVTSGDNDTFPLWFLQNVEKIRPDVRVINLSLLNADWYILQLKDIWKVPMTLTYDQIKWVPTRMSVGRTVRTLPRPKQTYYDPIHKQNRFLFPYYDEKSKRMIRVQDMMVENIVVANNWRYPFYFSKTTSSGNRVGLDNHVRREGLVDLLVPEEGKDMIDPERFHKNLWEVYKYRGLADMDVYKDDNTVGLLMNYGERFIELAEYYLSQNQKDEAKAELEKAVQVYPDYYRAQLQLYKLYNDVGEKTKADSLLSAYEVRMNSLTRKCPEIVLYFQYLGVAYQAHQKFDQAEKILQKAYEINPSDEMTFQILRQLYYNSKQSDKLVKLLSDWLEDHSDDEQSRKFLEYYKNQQ